jgi:hypothetical protein
MDFLLELAPIISSNSNDLQSIALHSTNSFPNQIYFFDDSPWGIHNGRLLMMYSYSACLIEVSVLHSEVCNLGRL